MIEREREREREREGEIERQGETRTLSGDTTLDEGLPKETLKLKQKHRNYEDVE